MLPFRPEWRYGATGDSMPWYRSVKLFRQINPGQWTDVIEKIKEDLSLVIIAKADGNSVLAESFPSIENIALLRNNLAVQ